MVRGTRAVDAARKVARRVAGTGGPPVGAPRPPLDDAVPVAMPTVRPVPEPAEPARASGDAPHWDERITRPIGDKPAWSACYAPHSSMYFDQHGKVRACCQSRGEQLGNVRSQSIREIWDGARVRAMRDDLEQGRFPDDCAFCRWQVSEGDEEVLFARGFDSLEVTSMAPEWPTQMEFALTNTCNLQCVMCSGNFSSAIRAQREGRPPMQVRYGEPFFEELAEFLPHLTAAKFLGGEPLLGREPLRVLEMLASLGAPPAVTITTNATICTPSVERILGRLKPNIVISLDGATAETFESIRLGASFSKVMDNIERYRQLVGPGKLSLTTCLMVDNWHEFPDLLAMASAWSMHLGVNVLHLPTERSLYQLAPEALGAVVDGLRSRRSVVPPDRRRILDEQINALHNRAIALAGSAEGAPAAALPIAPFLQQPGKRSRWGWLPFPEFVATDAVEDTASRAPQVGAEFLVGRDGVLHLQAGPTSVPASLRLLDAEPIETLDDFLAERYATPEELREIEPDFERSGDRHEFLLDGPQGSTLRLSVRARRELGELVGAHYRLEMAATDLDQFENVASRVRTG